MTESLELSAGQLRFQCDESIFKFDTTESAPPLEVMIGQERAVKAVEFGLFTKIPGYNIFMSGLVGTGKITYAKSAVQKVAQDEAVPDDWCYVNNFENPGQPIAVSLPAGQGSIFRQDMQDLVENLKSDIPKIFSGDQYEQAKGDIVKTFQAKRAVIMEGFNQYCEQNEISPQWSTTGFIGLPVENGTPVTPEEFQKLDKDKREAIEQKLLAVHEKAMDAVRMVQQVERLAREELKGLDTKVGLFAAGHFIDDLQEKYQDFEKVVAYLDTVKAEVVKNINDFKPAANDEENNPFLMFKKNMQDSIKDKYKVNLLVDNRDMDGAPVVLEINPTYYNLVGRVEYENRMGVVSTDFSMIKSGALHRANGGYLLLNVRDVLTNIGAWEGLKRVLKTNTLLIENLSDQYGMLAMASVKPQAIPLNVKIILIGNPSLYHLLFNYDEDFRKLFKIYADFDIDMKNNDVNRHKLAGFITSTVKKEQLKPFDRSAVAKMVEHATRLAGSQDKLTTRFSDIVEVVCEADTWATMDQCPVVSAQHIRKAVDEKRYRSNKYEEKLQEMFAEGMFLIDTQDERVGQVNGLAVLAVGEYTFGKPSRITANTYLGKHGVINIERETEMSGTSHSKGVLILGGYLGQKYAQDQPLTVTASLTFEQLYEGVDGDSASSTELYAILSSLSEIPIKQYIAVTGSVNQKGEIQPIGGATQKIEGFYAVCKLKGLNGKQGVMIPYQNVKDLTLNDEVVEAVQQGQFHIYPVKTIDQGIEILTGTAAETVHQGVRQKLHNYTETLLKLSKSLDKEDK
ncbi:Lon protease family protein [Anaerospora hongkongensis]|uniref:Lon protease family protein n=1 Tax=Anaerospora hongkongensis TaxID=244830 RepID=UPI0028965C3C|nr:AAA family ATPase [Anaerospora hongkongensis]